MFNEQEKHIIKDVLNRIEVGGKLPTPLLYPVLEAKVQLYYSSKHIQIELAKLGLDLTVNNINLILHKNRKRNKLSRLENPNQKDKIVDSVNVSPKYEFQEQNEKPAESLSQITARLEMEARNKRNGFDQFDKLKKRRVDNPDN